MRAKGAARRSMAGRGPWLGAVMEAWLKISHEKSPDFAVRAWLIG